MNENQVPMKNDFHRALIHGARYNAPEDIITFPTSREFDHFTTSLREDCRKSERRRVPPLVWHFVVPFILLDALFDLILIVMALRL